MVITQPPVKRVITSAPRQLVGPIIAVQQIVEGGASQIFNLIEPVARSLALGCFERWRQSPVGRTVELQICPYAGYRNAARRVHCGGRKGRRRNGPIARFIADRIIAKPALEDVSASTANQQIIAVATIKRVNSSAPFEHIGASGARDRIHARTADGVFKVNRTGFIGYAVGNRVRCDCSSGQVDGLGGGRHSLKRLIKRIDPNAAVQAINANTATDQIIAVPALERIIACRAVNTVIANAADDRLIACIAIDFGDAINRDIREIECRANIRIDHDACISRSIVGGAHAFNACQRFQANRCIICAGKHGVIAKPAINRVKPGLDPGIKFVIGGRSGDRVTALQRVKPHPANKDRIGNKRGHPGISIGRATNLRMIDIGGIVLPL